ncbi:MAG: response regulator transcription factor [Pseudomonadales bacterium]|nr:response regulator transcription factor [Pseudomonadales bacterium]
MDNSNCLDPHIVIVSECLEKKQELVYILQLLLKQKTCLFDQLNSHKINNCSPSYKLVICDADILDSNEWIKRVRRYKGYRYLAVTNIKNESHAMDMIQSGVHGVFYTDDSMEVIVKGVRHILNGELWYNRKLLSSMVASQFDSDSIIQRRSLYQLSIQFSKREIDVLKNLAIGKRNRDIANQLFISEHTVKSHVKHIFKKLEVKSRAEVIAWAQEYLPKEILSDR